MPTAVAEGTKLNPDTPMPLHEPPTGEPTSGTNVSLIQILDGSGEAVTAGLGFTCNTDAFEVVLCPHVFVTITLKR